MVLPEKIARALAPANKTELWETVILLIDESIKSETSQCVGKENKGEDRAWHCGRVDALMALKDLLVESQNAAAKQLGYDSSENGPEIR